MTTSRDARLPLVQCARLLRSVSVGRIVFTENALPAVRPVTFAALAGEVVIPVDDVWFERFDSEFLAFQADSIDPWTRMGWSVFAMGRATYLSNSDSVARVLTQQTVPWSVSPSTCHLVIDMEQVTGRRIALTAVTATTN
ncbi:MULTISPECIES: pyridoxamine 5'-phosphate oxidase family protein [unclassified Rhodococcus (in: high G+C Gram-positive bacteria)]|uniref:pyridoxamine 5'-phosphate oxidase family protein n=1 Tax=unclassified Rhodococcus (in: high G+C Gram-positive bacteria) TaxID=192944 RepID=UPI00163ABC25|nr:MULTISPECIES: pyridoxamine 5'-phosphate oxidase family protein [unclassified Rhodococcus (in: high G+C Gram-positive bacteria)]MBC2644552.1 pyridoxamine 5'-phosphate oxidase family protein [Rhodococcus sp. 3A]MBC2897759.1 pyridoxamine 5'-phosphate oxidase family protein [Rhodococcus sp. 4CII]